MNVTALYFSPTGGSKRSALSLAAALAPEGFAELDITCGAVAGDFGPGDVVVFSVPCYNGRVPGVAAGRLEQVHGHRTPCIISITYGNRDYDDSLLELQDIVQRQGFIVQGAAALVGQHTFGEIQVGVPMPGMPPRTAASCSSCWPPGRAILPRPWRWPSRGSVRTGERAGAWASCR